MVKNLIILALLVGLAVLVYLNYGTKLYGTGVNLGAPMATTTEHEVCAQVITGARDPKTGEIKEFPTPCDVPKGWEVIQNDVPSLDLQVQ